MQPVGNVEGVALSMERLSDVDSSEGSGLDLDQLPLPPITGDVTFQDVDFAFNEGATPVVSNVGFHVPSGFSVSIVGHGSGKSTIMKLLPRLYEPQAGRILIDGLIFRNYRLAQCVVRLALSLRTAFV